MKRRDFISLLVGMTTIAWPRAGLAQNVGRRRAIVLMGTADDVEAKDRAVALQQGLQKLGWIVGRDLQIDYLFAAGNAERLLAYANEAVVSKPDILLAQTNSAAKALQSVTRTLPIVFLQVSDPVGSGFVGSLAHPGGNITGFTNFEVEIGGKWLRTLKDIAPAVENVGFIFNPETSAHREFLQAARESIGRTEREDCPSGGAQSGGSRRCYYRVRLSAEWRNDCVTASHYQRKIDY